jgi:selenocysteine-specific elongation factor
MSGAATVEESAEQDRHAGAPVHVIATAGHVDHGKSSLILRLTGMDPDRLAEEKRRGLTIDLGFAWTRLPSGHEIGFVDVPGHERFIRNMLAGVGPIRLVLFVVAADEGWKPQSEEHLQILDLLGADGAVIALTKRDLVDEETATKATAEIRSRLAGTSLEAAPVIPCSATSGLGLEDLRAALDGMVAAAPTPETTGRPRHFLDRVFTIRGAGTVVTGTLTGGPLRVGDEAEILPSGHRARIRGLQTHKRDLRTAVPVSRVAVNLVGTPREELERGDVLGLPGQWRPTRRFEATLRTVRGLDRPLTAKGAYKLYAGSAERDVRIRFVGRDESLPPGDEGSVLLTVTHPLVVDLGDRFVLRDAGRRETVGGGVIVDPHPPARWEDSLAPAGAGLALGALDRWAFASLQLRRRRFVRESEFFVLTGLRPESVSSAKRLGSWVADAEAVRDLGNRLGEALTSFHRDHQLRPGMEIGEARGELATHDSPLTDPALFDTLVDHWAAEGLIARDGSTVRLPTHAASTAGREDADRLVEAVRSAEPSPPTVPELAAAGFGRELIGAVCTDGRLVKVSPDLVMTPELVARAEDVVRAAGAAGITVSAFRQGLGTSRKYALPLLEYLDARGITRRQGDLRLLRN